MRTIETTVYQFDELSEAAKEKAREWFRRGQDGDNYFAESVIEDAEQCAEFIGVEFDKRTVRLCGGGTRQEPCVYWSGFSSQGDGACFEGSWRADRVKPAKLKEHAPEDKELHRIAAEFESLAKKFPQAAFRVKHRGHYSHKYCTEFDFQFPDDNEGEDWPEEKRDAWNKVCDNLKEAARDFMEWIYDQLEKEHEYRNEDEQIDEAIRINEYEFTAEGERF